jgi:hypothetical protein
MSALTGHRFKFRFQKCLQFYPNQAKKKFESATGFRGWISGNFDRLRRPGLTPNYWRVLPNPVKFPVLGNADRVDFLSF